MCNPIHASEPANQHDNPLETPIIRHAASSPINRQPATTLIARPFNRPPTTVQVSW